MVKLGTLIKAGTLLAPGMLLLSSDLVKPAIKKLAKKYGISQADRTKLLGAAGKLHKHAKRKLVVGVRKARSGLKMVDEVLALLEKAVK